MSNWETLLRAGTGERDGHGGGWLWAGSHQLELPPSPYSAPRVSLAALLVPVVVVVLFSGGHGCAVDREQQQALPRRSESVVP